MNQECANKILGLKNTLNGFDITQQPHSYFPKLLDPTGSEFGKHTAIVVDPMAGSASGQGVQAF
jgi:hypothetical protein